MTVFEAYITNLGKYAEGQLVGETLKFPATTEEVQSLLKNIGVDGVRYEEFFITAFDGDVMGLYPQTRAAEESGSFLEQDSTTVPKSAYLRFCPFGKSCWGVPSPNPAMRHSPLENPTEKYLKNRPQNGGK